jgi:RNA polymerase sigma factor FliA
VDRECTLLWQQFRSGRRQCDRDALVQVYQRLARIVAARFFRQSASHNMEFADFYHFATVGLIESIDRYDPDRGVRFEAFAGPRIKGAIIDGLESSSEVQEQLAARRRVAADRSASLADAGQGSSNADVFARLAEIAVGLAIGFMLDGTGMIMGEDEAMVSPLYESVELRLLMGKVRAALELLPERSRQIMELHYMQQWTFEEVARHFSLTKGRISQIHKDALQRIRAGLSAPNGKNHLSSA